MRIPKTVASWSSRALALSSMLRSSKDHVSIEPWSRFFRPMSSSSSSSSSRDVVVEKTNNDTTNTTKQRKRRRAGNRLPSMVTDNIPSYKEFVHRFTVLSLYRSYMKEIRSLPHNQDDLKGQVQHEFKANRTITDPFNVQRALTEGKRRLRELQELTGSNNKYEGESWLNTPDQEDPRGRVGTGWPWERS